MCIRHSWRDWVQLRCISSMLRFGGVEARLEQRLMISQRLFLQVPAGRSPGISAALQFLPQQTLFDNWWIRLHRLMRKRRGQLYHVQQWQPNAQGLSPKLHWLERPENSTSIDIIIDTAIIDIIKTTIGSTIFRVTNRLSISSIQIRTNTVQKGRNRTVEAQTIFHSLLLSMDTTYCRMACSNQVHWDSIVLDFVEPEYQPCLQQSHPVQACGTIMSTMQSLNQLNLLQTPLVASPSWSTPIQTMRNMQERHGQCVLPRSRFQTQITGSTRFTRQSQLQRIPRKQLQGVGLIFRWTALIPSSVASCKSIQETNRTACTVKTATGARPISQRLNSQMAV